MKKPKHLLNYKILQEWGFVWVIKTDDIVTYYATIKFNHTDIFDLRNVSLMLLDPVYKRWIIKILDKRKKVPLTTLFYGRLNKHNLETILEATLIFKPKKDADKDTDNTK